MVCACPAAALRPVIGPQRRALRGGRGTPSPACRASGVDGCAPPADSRQGSVSGFPYTASRRAPGITSGTSPRPGRRSGRRRRARGYLQDRDGGAAIDLRDLAHSRKDMHAARASRGSSSWSSTRVTTAPGSPTRNRLRGRAPGTAPGSTLMRHPARVVPRFRVAHPPGQIRVASGRDRHLCQRGIQICLVHPRTRTARRCRWASWRTSRTSARADRGEPVGCHAR